MGLGTTCSSTLQSSEVKVLPRRCAEGFTESGNVSHWGGVPERMAVWQMEKGCKSLERGSANRWSVKKGVHWGDSARVAGGQVAGPGPDFSNTPGIRQGPERESRQAT